MKKTKEKEYRVGFYYSCELVRAGDIYVKAKSKKEAEAIVRKMDKDNLLEEHISSENIDGADFEIYDVEGQSK